VTIESHTWAGRAKVPLLKKLNPLWLFGNDFEPDPPQWYVEQEPKLTRLKWYLRNNMQNCGSYGAFFFVGELSIVLSLIGYIVGFSPLWSLVLLLMPGPGGFQDHNFKVIGTAPILTTDAEDIGKTGFMWKVCLLYGFIPLPYVSFCSSRWMFHYGWNPEGKHVRKLNIHGSKVQLY